MGKKPKKTHNVHKLREIKFPNNKNLKIDYLWSRAKMFTVEF